MKPAPRKNAGIFLLGGQIKNGRWRHLEKLTFEPEHLESSINTPFPINQPRGFLNVL